MQSEQLNHPLMKSNHIIEVKWSALTYILPMTAAHLRGITKVNKFLIVIINSMDILEQFRLVRLIAIYAFMRHCSFQICSHIHPPSLDAGLIIYEEFCI